jgi:hypothetical protein
MTVTHDLLLRSSLNLVMGEANILTPSGTRAIAACDAYRLKRWQNCTYPDGRVVSLNVEYFLKFFINKNGYVVSTISVHT